MKSDEVHARENRAYTHAYDAHAAAFDAEAAAAAALRDSAQLYLANLDSVDAAYGLKAYMHAHALAVAARVAANDACTAAYMAYYARPARDSE